MVPDLRKKLSQKQKKIAHNNNNSHLARGKQSSKVKKKNKKSAEFLSLMCLYVCKLWWCFAWFFDSGDFCLSLGTSFEPTRQSFCSFWNVLILCFLSVCWTWHRQTPYEGGFLIIWRYGEKVKELIVKKSRHRSFGVPKWINDDNRRRPTDRLRQSRRRVHPLQWTPQHSAWIRIPEPSRSLAHTSSLRMNPLQCFAVPKPDRQQWETCCWTNECAGGPRALGCDKRLI